MSLLSNKMYFTRSLTLDTAKQVLYEMGIAQHKGTLNSKYSSQRGVVVFGEKPFFITHADFDTLLQVISDSEALRQMSDQGGIPSNQYEDWVKGTAKALFEPFGTRKACSKVDVQGNASTLANASVIKEGSFSAEANAHVLFWVEDPCHCD